ncbi:MAG: DUF1592 domain-containing protein [Verrucomicrobia bacterium]|nr:DUF1592 domain-containing protein [Verrucomicrobiota bacterium]
MPLDRITRFERTAARPLTGRAEGYWRPRVRALRHEGFHRSSPGRWVTALASVALGIAAVTGAAASPAETFTKDIQPILKTYCYSCHGPEKQRADLNFANFERFDQVLEQRELWAEVLGRVQADEMPPKGARELDYNRRQTLMDWLRRLPKDELDCNQLATDRTQNFYRGYVMSRRLNRHEYENTVRDLTGLDLKVGRHLPADGAGGEGFDNTGDTLFTSSLAIERYLDAADEIVTALLPEEPSSLTPAARAARERLLVAVPGEPLPAREAARAVLGDFAARAFRRPVTPEEVERLLVLFDRGWSRGDGFEGSLRLALKAVLISPHFLFLAEPEPETTGVQPLAPFPLASRLAYFLWASMPDDELFRLAGTGELAKPEVYQSQVRRLLRDPKAAALGERFALQWLELERLGGEVRPDASRFPEFDDELATAMRAEVVAYFNHLIREDRPLLELLDSDYTFANERLARLYGIGAVGGPELRRVPVNDRARGGVIGMAAVHVVTSYPLRTSPVLRGKWLLESLLGERVPPPPPDVPALKVDDHTVTAVSLREQLQLHRQDPTCAACHDRMDPLGFGLENFDVLGRYRAAEGGQPVDASGVLPSGERFNGPAELKTVLLQRRDQIMRHLVRKLTGYAFGRELNKFDECVLRDALAALRHNDYRPGPLIETIAMSFPFRHRFYAKTESPPES